MPEPTTRNVLTNWPQPLAPMVPFGNFHLLAIGIGPYQHCQRLDKAPHDARELARVLHEHYGFAEEHIQLVLDEQATRPAILDKVRDLATNLTTNDHLLIGYFGHGNVDPLTHRGSWIPVEAAADNPNGWITNSEIKDLVAAMKARHVLVVSDSCFSGDLLVTRRLESPLVIDDAYVRKAFPIKSRQALTSGRREVVEDGVFGRHLVRHLEESRQAWLVASDLFERVKRGVAANATQVPQFGTLLHTDGDLGGEFVLFREGTSAMLDQQIQRRREQMSELELPQQASDQAEQVQQTDLEAKVRELWELEQRIQGFQAPPGGGGTGPGELHPPVSLKEEQDRKSAGFLRRPNRRKAVFAACLLGLASGVLALGLSVLPPWVKAKLAQREISALCANGNYVKALEICHQHRGQKSIDQTALQVGLRATRKAAEEGCVAELQGLLERFPENRAIQTNLDNAKKVAARMWPIQPELQTTRHWTNSLGMVFARVPATRVLSAIWKCRVQDFQAFAQATSYDAGSGMFSAGPDGWKQRGDSWQRPGFKQEPTHPVVGVSWHDAKAFCAWLTESERRGRQITGRQFYRLPTTEEWLRLAVGRAELDIQTNPWSGHSRNFSLSLDNLVRGDVRVGGSMNLPPRLELGGSNDVFEFDETFLVTAPAGSDLPSPEGFSGLTGKKWEWCEDKYQIDAEERIFLQAIYVLPGVPPNRTMVFRDGEAAPQAPAPTTFAPNTILLNCGRPDARVDAICFRCVLVASDSESVTPAPAISKP